MITHAREQLFTFPWCRSPDRFKVAVSEPDVGVHPLVVEVKVQERPRSKMEIRRIATHIDQAIDGPKRVDQLLVRHADAILGRRVGAGRKSGARGRRHGAANRNA
ncbi:MAG TPA: hypothetical protein VK540_04830 [Polyangiaceae bacterium]|nr:hypothetical protein [Polyangiaceae bacterium]